jgi:hypothetical protein
MSQKTTTISCRVDVEDADFLLALEVPGATTVSDKMRHVLSEYRQHQQNLRSFRDCLMDFRNLIAPTYQEIQDMEYSKDLHSEFVNRLVESLPVLMATLVTSRRPARAEEEAGHLHKLEKRLIDQVFQLIDSLLRIGVSASPACYDPEVFRAKLADLLSLTDVLSNQILKPKAE